MHKGFLYFLPDENGQQKVVEEKLRALGVGDLIAGLNSEFNYLTGSGPGGKRGVIVGPHYGAEPDARFLPDQTWVECLGGRFWLGWNEKPGPTLLARERLIGGYPATLGDGNEWVIPAARLHDGRETMLPQVLTLGASGERTRRVPGRYDGLVGFAQTAYDGLRHSLFGDGDEVRIDEDFKWRACCAALNANYRVTEWEVSALGLLTTDNMDVILADLVDFPAYARMRLAESEAAKKNGHVSTGDTLNSIDGIADSGRATIQPTQT